MSSAEVLRLGVMGDQRVGGLFRSELELLREAHPDPFRAQQPDNLGPVLEVGAGRVAERVAGSAVALVRQQVGEIRGVLGGEAELLAHALVPELRSASVSCTDRP